MILTMLAKFTAIQKSIKTLVFNNLQEYSFKELKLKMSHLDVSYLRNQFATNHKNL